MVDPMLLLGVACVALLGLLALLSMLLRTVQAPAEFPKSE